MKQFSDVDDELNDIVPSKPPAAAAPPAQAAPPPAPQTPPQAASPPAPPPPQASAKASAEEDIDLPAPATKGGGKDGSPVGDEVEWGDTELMKKGDGLERIRPEKKSDKVVRFALLPFIKPRGHRSHFVTTKEGKRQVLCLSQQGEPAFCCQKLDEEGRYHVIALALEYTNVDPRSGNRKLPDGKTPPIEWKIGFVDFSRPNFRSVSSLPEEGTSVYDYDIVMALNGNKYEFNIKARKANWKLDPALAKEVEAAAQKFIADGGKKLFRRLGKKATLLEWKALLAGAAAGAAEANLDNIEDL